MTGTQSLKCAHLFLFVSLHQFIKITFHFLPVLCVCVSECQLKIIHDVCFCFVNKLRKKERRNERKNDEAICKCDDGKNESFFFSSPATTHLIT